MAGSTRSATLYNLYLRLGEQGDTSRLYEQSMKRPEVSSGLREGMPRPLKADRGFT